MHLRNPKYRHFEHDEIIFKANDHEQYGLHDAKQHHRNERHSLLLEISRDEYTISRELPCCFCQEVTESARFQLQNIPDVLLKSLSPVDIFEMDCTGGTCSFELDFNHNPAQSYANELAPLPHAELLDTNNKELNTVNGIEATDVGSLLEQFEEVSQGLGDSDSGISLSSSSSTASFINITDSAKGVINDNTKSTTDVKNQEIQKSANVSRDSPKLEIDSTGNMKLSEDFLKKIRAKIKRKSAIMLPMGTPAKNGRGSAMAIPSHCQPTKLQKIMMQKSQSADNLTSIRPFTPEPDCSSNLSTASEGAKPKKQVDTDGTFKVNNDYYDLIMDHDYCVNSFKPENVSEKLKKNTKTADLYPEEDILDLEDGEVMDDLDCDKENQDNSRDSGIQDTFPSSAEKSRQSRSKRNYRSKREDTPDNSGDERYFDKIPTYYTALSLSSKPPKKNSSKAVTQNKFSNLDYIERDPSPTRDNSLYSKIPAYHSCFTNSTKYDSSKDRDSSFIDLTQDSKLSSGYSSRSHSPSLVIDSRRYSRSRSRSRSHSRSRSPSCSRQNRSRSRDMEMRGRRRRRSSSSSSRSRSRSSGYSRSRSRSLSRSSCSSRSRSRSHSRSRRRSKTRSKSAILRRLSIERRREERQKLRDEEKRIQIEERRIVYVGKIPENFTRSQLRRRFIRFGEIEEVSVHFREAGDNYGFVTFAYTCDAYAAVEKGNTVPGELHFDLCFGGRRQFCETEYADLDGNMEMQEEFDTIPQSVDNVDFDELLKQAVKQASSKS